MNIYRARLVRWPVDVPERWANEIAVVVGSLAHDQPSRAARLVPRIEEHMLAGYDLRFDR